MKNLLEKTYVTMMTILNGAKKKLKVVMIKMIAFWCLRGRLVK